MSADPNYVIGVVATALQECKVDTVSQEWVLLELRAALVAPDPAPTGYLPGMAFGTGGNRLDPAPTEPLDVERLARALSVAGPLCPDSGIYARVIAAEYDRLTREAAE